MKRVNLSRQSANNHGHARVMVMVLWMLELCFVTRTQCIPHTSSKIYSDRIFLTNTDHLALHKCNYTANQYRHRFCLQTAILISSMSPEYGQWGGEYCLFWLYISKLLPIRGIYYLIFVFFPRCLWSNPDGFTTNDKTGWYLSTTIIQQRANNVYILGNTRQRGEYKEQQHDAQSPV